MYRLAAAGIAMVEFVKLAQRLTGRVFTFSEKEIAGAEPVKFTGSVHMKKDAFLPFFQTMLYVKGFATRIRDEGDAEVAAELEGHKADTATILTSIGLAHVAPQLVIDRVRAALAATANDATLAVSAKALVAGRQPAVVVLAHGSANALLISGPRGVVKEAVEVVGLLDRAAKK
jgi:hypothetical protein